MLYIEDNKERLEYFERRARYMEQKARHYEQVAREAVEALNESEGNKEVSFEELRATVADEVEKLLQEMDREKTMKAHGS